MPTTSFESSLNSIADKLAVLANDILKLEVKTTCVEVGENEVKTFAEQSAVAQTTLSATGDYASTVPVRKNADGRYEVFKELNDLHLANVRRAMDYRAEMFNTLWNVVQAALKR